MLQKSHVYIICVEFLSGDPGIVLLGKTDGLWKKEGPLGRVLRIHEWAKSALTLPAWLA